MTDDKIPNAFLIEPKIDENGGATVVLLDRIEPGQAPDYQTRGRVSCVACDEWCWLGDKTYEAVLSGAVVGLCLVCAGRMIPNSDSRVGRIDDSK